MTRAALIAAVLCGACASGPAPVPTLSSARVVSDFRSYSIHRVGVAPVSGPEDSGEQSRDLQSALLGEFSARTPYELVDLSAADLAEIPPIEPYRRGWYRPAAIRDVARRYRLDALIVATVTDLQLFPPQRLGVQVDLLSCETGQTLWAGTVQLDAADARVRAGLEAWAQRHGGDLNETGWELALISPRRFARFAAFQLARAM